MYHLSVQWCQLVIGVMDPPDFRRNGISDTENAQHLPSFEQQV